MEYGWWKRSNHCETVNPQTRNTHPVVKHEKHHNYLSARSASACYICFYNAPWLYRGLDHSAESDDFCNSTARCPRWGHCINFPAQQISKFHPQISSAPAPAEGERGHRSGTQRAESRSSSRYAADGPTGRRPIKLNRTEKECSTSDGSVTLP